MFSPKCILHAYFPGAEKKLKGVQNYLDKIIVYSNSQHEYHHNLQMLAFVKEAALKCWKVSFQQEKKTVL